MEGHRSVLLESVVLGVRTFSVPPIVVTLLCTVACSAFWGPCFEDGLEKTIPRLRAVCRRTPVSAGRAFEQRTHERCLVVRLLSIKVQSSSCLANLAL